MSRKKKEMSRMQQSTSLSLAPKDQTNIFYRTPSTPILLKTQSTKFTQQVESLREKINAFKMFVPTKVPSLASLSGFSVPTTSPPSSAHRPDLPGQKAGSPLQLRKMQPQDQPKQTHFAQFQQQLQQQSQQIQQQQKQMLYHPNMEISSTQKPSHSTSDVSTKKREAKHRK
eukprot:Phypoly_transcript_11380.p1 GENE.Phypoly_transcript_11380~~Phypoly_transcript_11380.p1  ORF type:complete len:171 (+),score=37.98 Phypoly_transcript_11380:359-871(+)